MISRTSQQNAELKTFAIEISSVTTRHVVLTLYPGSDFRVSFCPVLGNVGDIYMILSFKRPCPHLVSFTQRPNAICQHPRLKPVCWLRVCGLSHLSVPTQSAVLHLWILMALQLVTTIIDHRLVNRTVSVM